MKCGVFRRFSVIFIDSLAKMVYNTDVLYVLYKKTQNYMLEGCDLGKRSMTKNLEVIYFE